MENPGEEDQLLKCLCCKPLWIEDVITVSQCDDKLCNSDLSSKLAFIIQLFCWVSHRCLSLVFSDFLPLSFHSQPQEELHMLFTFAVLLFIWWLEMFYLF